MTQYGIPLFDLNFDGREETAVLETLRSRWISTGPKTIAFENKFSDMLGVRHALAVSNGTVALHLALRVLGIGPGDEVIVPSLTFVATVNAVRYVGAEPVFCDISGPDNLTIDPANMESLITGKTRAAIVMHYGGFPCDMRRILSIARSNGFKVIEDACHAPLSECDGSKAGTVGDIGCFSFFSNKNISTGEGGMLVTGSDSYYEKAKLLRSHGMTTLSYERASGHATVYDVLDLGYNYRFDDIRASIGLVQLEKLKADLAKRAEIRRLYIERLSGLDEIIVPFREHAGTVSNYIFPVVLKKNAMVSRNEMRERLHEKGIQTSVHYPAAHRFTIYRRQGFVLPVTEYVADHEMTLPMYSSLRHEQVDFIAESLKHVFSSGSRS